MGNRVLKDNVGSFQRNVTEYDHLATNNRVVLDATETRLLSRTGTRKVHILPRDGDVSTSDGKGEVRQRCGTWENVAAFHVVQGHASNTGVVCLGDR